MIDPKTILVHAPNWVGDHTMAFPFYAVLNRLFPRQKKILIGRAWIESLLPPNIFDESFTLTEKNASPETLQTLRARKVDLAFTLSPSFRSAWLLRQIKATWRIGYKTDMRSVLLRPPPETGALRLPPHHPWEHRALSFIRLLTPFFEPEMIAEDYFEMFRDHDWHFPLGASEKNEIEEMLAPLKLTTPFWIICPGSVAPSKVYPMKHLAEVIRLSARKQPNLNFLLVGSHIEREYANQLKKLLTKGEQTRVYDVTAKTSLKQVLYLLQKAVGCIANDSGVAHMSSLTKTPLVTFVGMGRKEETLVLNPRKKVLNLNLRCAPCGKKVCPRKDSPLECLEKIPPTEVANAMTLFSA